MADGDSIKDQHPTTTYVPSLDKERAAEARKRIGKPKVKKERPSWISVMLTWVCTLVMGSPAAHDMREDLYNLPFEREEQAASAPSEVSLERIRNNMYTNMYRRSWLSALAWPVAIYLALVVFLAPLAITETKEWIAEVKVKAEKKRTEKIASLVASFGPATAQSCAATLDDVNALLADVNELDVDNFELEQARAKAVEAGEKDLPPLKLKDNTVLDEASVKEKAHWDYAKGPCIQAGLIEQVPAAPRDYSQPPVAAQWRVRTPNTVQQ